MFTITDKNGRQSRQFIITDIETNTEHDHEIDVDEILFTIRDMQYSNRVRVIKSLFLMKQIVQEHYPSNVYTGGILKIQRRESSVIHSSNNESISAPSNNRSLSYLESFLSLSESNVVIDHVPSQLSCCKNIPPTH